MATTFEGATRADVQRFAPEAIDSIVLGPNLRLEIDDAYIEELAHSIAKYDQLEPGIVRRDSEGRPVLVAGFCRLEAVKRINADPAAYGADKPKPYLAVFRRMNEDEALEVNLEENLKRRDLSPMDLARAAVQLERIGWERARIASAMHCTAAHVGSLLSLVELPGNVTLMVHRRRLPVSAALALRKLPRERVDALAERLESGEVTAQVVIREAKAEKRAAGKKLGRTLGEVKAFLEDLATGPATDLLAWIDGELPDDAVASLLAERDPVRAERVA